MKEIGGYFEFELPNRGSIFHDTAVAVNSGRNAFLYIIKTLKNVNKVYLPLYSCDVLQQPLASLNLSVEFYRIDQQLKPVGIIPGENEYLLIINYFGILNHGVSEFTEKYSQVIIDSTQGFYFIPKIPSPVFYSARKFFGVPDGGFAYSGNKDQYELERDSSLDRIEHLIGRIEKGAQDYYSTFRANEQKLDSLPLRKMSILTERILRGVDYETVRQARNKNFQFYHKALGKINELTPVIEAELINAPLCYPFLKKGNNRLRSTLIENRIYIPTYWPNVYQYVETESWEFYLTDNLLALPIDQRYTEAEIQQVIDMIWKFF